jgi:hypothetical protein
MGEQHARQRLPRTRLPWQIRARLRDVKEVRLLDLSLGGPRLEHLGLLRREAHCEVEPPALLGGLCRAARVTWSLVIGRRRGFERDRHLLAHTGLRFAPLTATQQTTLTDVLQRVTARQRSRDSRRGSAWGHRGSAVKKQVPRV